MPTILGLFQAADLAEQAVAELSLNGFTEKDVGIVLFSAVAPPRPGGTGLVGWLQRGGLLGDTLDHADGVSVMDGISIGAVLLGVLGLVWGSRLGPGPVALATLGMLGGGLIGYICDRLIPEKRRDLYDSARIDGLIMIKVTSPVASRSEEARAILERAMAKQVAVVSDLWQ